jgi:hypothetical protein
MLHHKVCLGSLLWKVDGRCGRDWMTTPHVSCIQLRELGARTSLWQTDDIHLAALVVRRDKLSVTIDHAGLGRNYGLSHVKDCTQCTHVDPHRLLKEITPSLPCSRSPSFSAISVVNCGNRTCVFVRVSLCDDSLTVNFTYGFIFWFRYYFPCQWQTIRSSLKPTGKQR